MNTPVSFEIAKLLKEKGFDNECEYFYSKYGGFNSLKPHREYEHLHSYSELLVSYFDGKYKWNSLDVDEGMIELRTSFSESDGYVNCECSAPTIAEVVMWVYDKHGVWINLDAGINGFYGHYMINPIGTLPSNLKHGWINETPFKSPTEAYEAAIEYTLNNLI